MRAIFEKDYYGALARFMLAREYQKKVDELELEMSNILSVENGSHMSDEIYMPSSRNAEQDFKAALLRSDIVIINDADETD